MLQYPDWLPRSTVKELGNAILNVYKTDWGQLAEWKNAELFGAEAAFNSETNFGAVINRKDSIIIACRGTNTVEEWITDTEFIKTRAFDGWGFVHNGFLQMYMSCIGEVIKCLAGVNAACRIYITGHSLGAAVATLLAADLSMIAPAFNVTLCTFASPRVGNADFVRAFSASKIKSLRITNTADIVPDLPPEIMGFADLGEAHSFTDEKGGIITRHQILTYIRHL